MPTPTAAPFQFLYGEPVAWAVTSGPTRRQIGTINRFGDRYLPVAVVKWGNVRLSMADSINDATTAIGIITEIEEKRWGEADDKPIAPTD